MTIERIKALAGRIQDAEYAAIVDEVVELEMQRDALLESLQYAVRQVPELASVPGVAASLAKAEGGAA